MEGKQHDKQFFDSMGFRAHLNIHDFEIPQRRIQLITSSPKNRSFRIILNNCTKLIKASNMTGAILFDRDGEFEAHLNIHDFEIPQRIIRLMSSPKSRSFRIKLNNCTKLIKAGVPQGAVLSPLLFHIYNADFLFHPRTKLVQFTDDTYIARSKGIKRIKKKLQDNVTDIENEKLK